MSAPDPAALADRLRAATDRRTEIPKLTDSEPGLDPQTAYEVQRLGVQRRLAEGERMIGYKLGLTSRAKQLAMGVADPLWGRLHSGLLIDEEVGITVSELIHPRVEPEIAFLLGADIDGATATTASVLAATRGVFPALELLDSRYQDFQFTLADVIADNASAAGVICGGRLLDPATLDLQLEGIVVRRDGEVVETAAGAAVSGHPAAAVAWLARQVGTLEAGAIVISGGLTAPVALAPGMTITAQYTHLGTVTLRCA